MEQLAARMNSIQPFHVMEILRRAGELEAAGRDVIHMEVGEPDFPTPAPIIAAAQHFLEKGSVRYTAALGLPALREAISAFYATRFGCDVPAARIVITPGASGALMLALGVSTNPGDQWLLPDPGYPSNRHFVRAFEGEAIALPVGPETHYQPSPKQVSAAWGPRTRGLMVASPSNPTGTLLDPTTLAALEATCQTRQGILLVDEIYQGLTYDVKADTALRLHPEAFVVNSFSKYFGMTGWRLGWLVVPPQYIRAVEKLAQHFFISPSTPAQHAALAAFHPETLAILEERRQAFAQRRAALLAALPGLGFKSLSEPQGAFYVYVDVSALNTTSSALAARLIEEAGVATTPGVDFGGNKPEQHLRIAYTTGTERIEEACERIRTCLTRHP